MAIVFIKKVTYIVSFDLFARPKFELFSGAEFIERGLKRKNERHKVVFKTFYGAQDC